MIEELTKELIELEQVLDKDGLFLKVTDEKSLLNGLAIQRRNGKFVLGFISKKSVLHPLEMFEDVTDEFVSLSDVDISVICLTFKAKVEFLEKRFAELETQVVVKHKRRKGKNK